MAYAPGHTYAGQPTAGGGFFANGWESVAFFGGVTSTLLGAVSNFYATKNAQHQAKSAALDLEFQASMANLNARAAEEDAQAELEAGQQDKALATLQYGQVKADAAASAGARGVSGASVQEQLASIELAKEMDAAAITRNAVRAANRRRGEAVNERNRALLSRVGAGNLRSSAGSLNPGLAAGASLLSGAGSLASNWIPRRGRY